MIPKNIWSRSVSDNCKLRIGKWISVSKGDVLDMNVLIGDWGGETGFFLMIEQQGQTYKTMPDGTPVLPLFQVGAKFPAQSGPETPPISESDSVWTPVSSN